MNTNISKKTEEKFKNINLDEFIEFWKYHNDQEILDKYNLSYKIYKKYCLINNIIKNKERFIYLQNKSRLEKYGDPHYRNRQKAEQTLLDRYGDPHFHNIEQAKATNLKKYGREYGFDYEKSKITCLDKYGTPICSQSELVKEHAKHNNNIKYGVDFPMQLSQVRSKARSKYYYDNRVFDSGWEIYYYIWLKDFNIKFSYHPDISIQYSIDDTIHYYQPDFIVDDKLVEIKSEWLLNIMKDPANYADHQKYICMLNNNVTIISRPDINFYIDYVKEKYGIDYVKSFKVKDTNNE